MIHFNEVGFKIHNDAMYVLLEGKSVDMTFSASINQSAFTKMKSNDGMIGHKRKRDLAESQSCFD